MMSTIIAQVPTAAVSTTVTNIFELSSEIREEDEEEDLESIDEDIRPGVERIFNMPYHHHPDANPTRNIFMDNTGSISISKIKKTNKYKIQDWPIQATTNIMIASPRPRFSK